MVGHLLHLGERLVGLALVDVGHGRPEQRQAPLAVVARLLPEPGEAGAGVGGLAHEHLVVADADVGGHEVGVDAERFLVVPDRVLELAHLHQQLGVGVVGVGVVRDQLDVLLEGLLRVRVLAQEAVGVAHLVVGLGERGRDRDRLLVLGDGRGPLLPAEVIAAEQVVSALVRRVGGRELAVELLLPLRQAPRAGVEPVDHPALRLRDLRARRLGLLQRVEEVLRGAGCIGEAQVSKGESRVLLHGLLELRPRVRRA